MSVPMGQICLMDDCKKPAKHKEGEMYYCTECLDKLKSSSDDIAIIPILQDAIDQINYLSKKLSIKNFNFTRPSTKKTIHNIEKAINYITSKGESDETENTEND